jgi:hypothetical protein
MKIGEVEVGRIPAGEEVRCHATHHHRFAVAYFNGTPDCGECLADELLSAADGREIVGRLLAGLIKE